MARNRRVTMLPCGFGFRVCRHKAALCFDGGYAGNREVTLGIMPGAGGTQNLARAVGERRAKQLILSGLPFTAVGAEAWGLVNRVVEPSDLLVESTISIARRIAAIGPIAVRQAKQAIHSGMQMSLWDGLASKIEAYNRLVPTEDRREGYWRSTNAESQNSGDFKL
jgi:enoyl-CoA hydratase/carnithine racemase